MRFRKVKAILDSSVLVEHRARYALVDAARLNYFKAYWSPWIIGETYRVLTVHRLEQEIENTSLLLMLDKRGKQFRNAVLDTISQDSKHMMTIMNGAIRTADPIPPWRRIEAFRDADDDPIYVAARLVRARYIVSRNTQDFPTADASGRHFFEGIEYIEPEAFLGLFDSQRRRQQRVTAHKAQRGS